MLFLVFSYQLALVTPGILPSKAIFRKATLQSPNCLIYPFGLPVSLHLLCNLTFEEFFGSLSNSSHFPSFFNLALSSAYFATILSLFFSLAIMDFFAMSY